MAADQKAQSPMTWLVWGVIGLIDLLLLYGVTLMYAQGEIAFALIILLIVCVGTWVFISRKGYNYRYVFPALLGVSVFIVFPLIYTVYVAFTNYSSSHLLTMERVKLQHLSKTYRTEGASYQFKVYQQGSDYRILFTSNKKADKQFITQPFNKTSIPTPLSADFSSSPPQGSELPLRDTIKLRNTLKKLSVELPDKTELTMTGLRSFGPMSKVYRDLGDGTLEDVRNGNLLKPDLKTGYYIEVPKGQPDSAGSQIGPGFVVYNGWENFVRVIKDPGIQGPFLQIFIWTLVFSGLSVLFTVTVGLLMACLVQWEPLKGNGVYRLLLILPYAVPAFISILIFRGLFNQNFGEINLLLNLLFGVQPEWFTNGYLAKTMVLIVNTWLGYPYMMILAIGLLKSIPDDLYEASAIDGASPVQNFFNITLPMIIKPMTPLLIASFAFNFNNLVLIALLTDGAPNIIGASTPAGATDILVSYTFRIAFGQSGQDYGLASAIATFIFIMVGIIAWANLRVTRRLLE
ncbi:maltose ABC transporter permease MalF [Endozoicomonas sp. 4G]|uniref:maltose ABC transporter permease MalF n=1 Tax=Endozoicomonas sp. 4G TaxID=2872754 RepID=UPI002078EF93|nr:maltose ABC transporter permease MalF [Endozoicomonas sp. 4G]